MLPKVQGRVFATRALIVQISTPIVMVIAGSLADRVMTPSMMPRGALYGVFGWFVGTGPGAGIGLLFVFLGIIGALISVGALAIKTIRNVESDIPDHDTVKKEEPASIGTGNSPELP